MDDESASLFPSSVRRSVVRSFFKGLMVFYLGAIHQGSEYLTRFLQII